MLKIQQWLIDSLMCQDTLEHTNIDLMKMGMVEV